VAVVSREFPDVPKEYTTPKLERGERVECFVCGNQAYRIEEGGGMITHYCRDCTGLSASGIVTNYGSAWGRVRDWVIERDGGGCRNCGDSGELHVHHIKKLVSFRTTDEAHRPDNLLTLCDDCHDELEDEPATCRSLLEDHFVEI